MVDVPLILVSAVAVFAAALTAQTDSKPRNVILIMADDSAADN